MNNDQGYLARFPLKEQYVGCLNNNLIIMKDEVQISPIGDSTVDVSSNRIKFTGSISAPDETLEVDAEEASHLFAVSSEYFPKQAIPHQISPEIVLSALQYAVTPDGMPFLGPLKKYSNVYVNIGHGINAGTVNIGSARIVAHQIALNNGYIDSELDKTCSSIAQNSSPFRFNNDTADN